MLFNVIDTSSRTINWYGKILNDIPILFRGANGNHREILHPENGTL